jgi:hypothetical protein
MHKSLPETTVGFISFCQGDIKVIQRGSYGQPGLFLVRLTQDIPASSPNGQDWI